MMQYNAFYGASAGDTTPRDGTSIDANRFAPLPCRRAFRSQARQDHSMSDDHKTQTPRTRLIHAGRGHLGGETAPVNPPIVRTSTVLYRNMGVRTALAERRSKGERVWTYGTSGSAVSFALEDAITEVEGGTRTMLFGSGLAAVAHPLLAILKPGDHVLFAETIYQPARTIATDYLTPRGITCEFYTGGHEEVAKRIRPETRMVYLDNPGSIVFDIQDVPALAAVCKGRGRDILIAVDNTWGAPGIYRPLMLGADISIVAVTKYIAGHSDLLMGSVTANARCADHLYKMAGVLGQVVTPDDAYTALRGLRTAHARLAIQHASTMTVIAWLQKQPEVARVLCPALATDPGHALWTRDFNGCNSLFSVAFKPSVTTTHANAFVDALRLFGIGASWGGYECLALTYPPERLKGWTGGSLIRLHVGLEDPTDIIADLQLGFEAIRRSPS
jgi:cysteine-S-conjugate beta-lyase